MWACHVCRPYEYLRTSPRSKFSLESQLMYMEAPNQLGAQPEAWGLPSTPSHQPGSWEITVSLR